MRQLTVAFDLDGTLADTLADIHTALQAALRACGQPDVPRDAMAGWVGAGARALVATAWAHGAGAPPTDAALDEAHAAFVAAYSQCFADQTALYPGARSALDALGGWRLAVCTNKPAAIADRILVALGIRDRFAALIGGDSLPVRKPDPAPLWAALGPHGGLLVGDSSTDVRTARAAGVPVIWVPWGYPGPDGAAPPADATVASFAELPGAVERLLGPEPSALGGR